MTIEYKRMVQRNGTIDELPNATNGEFYITNDTKEVYFGAGETLNKLVSFIGNGLDTETIPIYRGNILEINKSGFYYAGQESINKPTDGVGFLESIVYDDDSKLLKFYTLTFRDSFTRTKSFGVWGNWRKEVSMIDGTINPEGNVEALPGTFYSNSVTGDLYYKQFSSSVNGWKQVRLT